MAGIRDVSQIYNSTNKKITGKISFKIGDSFAAKILSRSEDGKGIVLRTIDGWQFPAILEEPIGLLPELLVKFQVLGYDNGEIKLKLVPKEQEQKPSEEESLLQIAKSNGLEEEDIELLKSMTTFSIPLDRENISKVKSLVDFLRKINQNPDEIDQFISKYLKSKEISNESKEGIEITNILKGFFEEFKEMPLEDLLLFQENGIELTEENINSYRNIFQKSEGLNNSLKTIINAISNFQKESSNKTQLATNSFDQEELFVNHNLREDFAQVFYKELEVEPEVTENYDSLNNDNYDKYDNYDFNDTSNDTLNDSSIKANNESFATERSNKVKVEVKPVISEEFAEKLTQTIIDELPEPIKEVKPIIKDEVIPKVIEKVKERIQYTGKVEVDEVVELIKDNLKNTPQLKDSLRDDDLEELSLRLKLNKEFYELTNVKKLSNTSIKVMEGIKEKLEELKSLVKTIMDAKTELDPKAWNGILNNVKANINDIKMFNTISGEYYYMDVPIKFKEDEYPCKLIIKDDRKKGKRIDSNNVKMVVSVSTVKMGKIDIYIQFKDRNMKLDFKCEQQWVDILDMAKEKLYKILSRSNYNVLINVSEKEKEMSLANCREFFQDTHNSNINVVV